MSAFIAIGGAEPKQKLPLIDNALFWPQLDPNECRITHRLGDTITDERLHQALIQAAAITNRVLRPWRVKQSATTLEDVITPKWMPINGLVNQYLRAVYCEAHATLLDHYRDYDATSHGTQDSDIRTDMAARYRQNARWAVCEIMDRPHTTVELI